LLQDIEGFPGGVGTLLALGIKQFTDKVLKRSKNDADCKGLSCIYSPKLVDEAGLDK
jgi:hypothetical protein